MWLLQKVLAQAVHGVFYLVLVLSDDLIGSYFAALGCDIVTLMRDLMLQGEKAIKVLSRTAAACCYLSCEIFISGFLREGMMPILCISLVVPFSLIKYLEVKTALCRGWTA